MSAQKLFPKIVMSALIVYSLAAFAQQRKTNDYSSPKSVYESFRDASRARHWDRYLGCLTETAQKYELIGAFFDCTLVDDDEGKRHLRTFVNDWNKLKEDYDTKKEAKLRAIAAKGDQAALKEAQESYNSIHNDLFRDAFFDHIPDKVGFYSAARALLENPLQSVLGEFEKTVVTGGDRATGTAKMTTFHLDSGKKVADEGNKTFHFRKIDGKWLIDVPQ